MKEERWFTLDDTRKAAKAAIARASRRGRHEETAQAYVVYSRYVNGVAKADALYWAGISQRLHESRRQFATKLRATSKITQGQGLQSSLAVQESLANRYFDQALAVLELLEGNEAEQLRAKIRQSRGQ